MQNTRNSLCKNNEQFLWENNEQFFLMQKTNFMNAVSKFEYTVNMMCRVQNVETDFINAEKQIHSFWNLNMKKHSDLAFKIRKQDFIRCFMRKWGIIF